MKSGERQELDTLIIEKGEAGFYVVNWDYANLEESGVIDSQREKALAGPLPSEFSAQKFILKRGMGK